MGGGGGEKKKTMEGGTPGKGGNTGKGESTRVQSGGSSFLMRRQRVAMNHRRG